MSPLNKINIAAVNWERTKDPKYKKEWYKLIKRWSSTIRKKPKINDRKISIKVSSRPCKILKKLLIIN